MNRRPGGDIRGGIDAGKGITLTKNGCFRSFRQVRRQNLSPELADLIATISGVGMELTGEAEKPRSGPQTGRDGQKPLPQKWFVENQAAVANLAQRRKLSPNQRFGRPRAAGET